MKNFIVASLLLGLVSCSKKPSKVTRDYSIDPESEVGLVYGKVNHDLSFGGSFTVVFKNPVTSETMEYLVRSVTENDTEHNFFIEMPPGEWIVSSFRSTSGKEFLASSIKVAENKEFVVEPAFITYVGTWNLSQNEFTVANEKAQQDNYMKLNYRYVNTTNALVSLP